MKKCFITLGLAALLLSAAVLTWSAFKPAAEPSITQPLAELITTGEEFGWSYEDLPLGPTEAIEEASERKLNMTDFLYRRFTKGPDSFDLYIGYWEPGRMPARLMNGHVPDTCWVNAGWEISEKNNSRIMKSQQIHTATGRWRWFDKSGARINVIFWHLLDSHPYQYGHLPLRQRIEKVILDPFRTGFNLSGEQFLIRISSPAALDQYWNTLLMSQIMKNLTFTGLVAKPRDGTDILAQ